VNHSLHFDYLAVGGRLLPAIDLGVDRCIVKKCGGDVYKMGYCLEHYRDNERDLVGTLELELNNMNNPYVR